MESAGSLQKTVTQHQPVQNWYLFPRATILCVCRTTLPLTSGLTPHCAEGEYKTPDNANITELPYGHALRFAFVFPAFWQSWCGEGCYMVAKVTVQQITAECSCLPSNSRGSVNPKSWAPLWAASQILRKVSGSVGSSVLTTFKITPLDVILHSRQQKASTVTLSLS